MSKKKSRFANIIRALLIIAIVIALVIVCVLLKQGYDVYSEKINEYPVSEAFEDIMSSDAYVTYDSLPQDYINAVIAVEDHRFFYRDGIDVVSIARAFMENLTQGSVVSGGSTITQQVAKNIYFDMSRTLSRKLAEIFFVNDIESKYSKEEIFAVYVSIIYFGDGYTGIKDAAQGYLGKDYTELSLCESALMAGLPQSPSNYQLSNESSVTYRRYLQVLDAMLQYDYIDETQYNYCEVNVPAGVVVE